MNLACRGRLVVIAPRVDRILWTKETRTTPIGTRTRTKGSTATSEEDLTPPSRHDQVGPADPVTNLRKIRLYVPPNETNLHKRLRELRLETYDWSTDFWRKHNAQFANEREEFVKKLLREKYPHEPNKSTVSAEEMSLFYRNFLNNKWSDHLNYNIEWQKRNARILGLSLLAFLQSLFQKRHK